MQNEYLNEVRLTFESVTLKVQESFSHLSEKQLNWKPKPHEWSIAQCIDHVMTINKLYLPQLIEIGDKIYTPRFWHKIPFIDQLWGNLIRKSVDPSNTKKSKTPTLFNPAISDSRTSILKEFQKHQKELLTVLDRTAGLDHQKIKVSSPASSLVTLSLENCWKILALHEERHFNQAKKIMDMSKFPKSFQRFA